MKTWQSVLLGIFLGMIFAGIIFIVAKQPSGQPIYLSPSSTPSPARVYIKGAVQHPGVYALPVASRVQEVVDLAGGFVDGADLEAVNLAAVLVDGQKIVVPYQTMTIPTNVKNSTPSPTQSSFPIDINTATKEEFDLLPGIGASKADEIVKYRDQKGPFKTIEEIQNVPGIGPGIFSKIKDLIIIN